MDFTGLAANLGIDREDFIELVELFINTTRNDLEKMAASLLSSDSQGAAQAAHSIKGAAGNLGFVEMAEVAKTLEMEAKEDRLDGFDNGMGQLELQLGEIENHAGL
ncbi:MAG: Hpt domain-containing protein [Desulfobacteraceae bacterium]|nr:MAG: Hpt domain-containing protein [Desulfobacteraceae bacterium]